MISINSYGTNEVVVIPNEFVEGFFFGDIQVTQNETVQTGGGNQYTGSQSINITQNETIIEPIVQNPIEKPSFWKKYLYYILGFLVLITLIFVSWAYDLSRFFLILGKKRKKEDDNDDII